MAVTETFDHTGAVQTWVVPAGVTEVSLEAWGAEGGGAYDCSDVNENDGGLGGYATGTLAVTEGQTLEIYVGGFPGDPGPVSGQPGGFNGGGDGGRYGAGGGGASDVRVGGSTLADRVLVAGGGGGGNGGCPQHGAGGDGGGLVGADGTAGNNWTPAGGGSQVAGGAAGSSPGTAGALGLGGSNAAYHIAGGGGGYYGGGSAYAAGGGGGSSYIGGVSGGSTAAGQRSGHGSVVITYVIDANPNAVDNARPVPAISAWASFCLVSLMLAAGLIGVRRRLD
ncbi:glycine-rich protein [Seongchinamella sediminis]|nr:glycine-rich protein [Seongchinamella sediminis]